MKKLTSQKQGKKAGRFVDKKHQEKSIADALDAKEIQIEQAQAQLAESKRLELLQLESSNLQKALRIAIKFKSPISEPTSELANK